VAERERDMKIINNEPKKPMKSRNGGTLTTDGHELTLMGGKELYGPVRAELVWRALFRGLTPTAIQVQPHCGWRRGRRWEKAGGKWRLPGRTVQLNALKCG